MIAIILSFILFTIFSILSGFHFYWLLGGNWGLRQAIPRKSIDEDSVQIPAFATLLVALSLAFVAFSYLIKSGILNIALPHWFANYWYWFIPIVFLIRAIGDFNYVGLFKKIKGTIFAKADTQLFVPLCISIGIIGILIQVLR